MNNVGIRFWYMIVRSISMAQQHIGNAVDSVVGVCRLLV